MNSASNKVNVRLSTGRRRQIQVVHLADPLVSKRNPSGVAEDSCVIFEEGGTQPFLFRIAARNPLNIEQLDLDTPHGRNHWDELRSYLETF